MSSETPTVSQPIRFFKLRNRGSNKVHFLVEDAAGDQKVWSGGPILERKTEAVVDLSSIPEIQSGTSYRFGAYVLAGRSATADHAQMVDSGSNMVGVFTWTIDHGSKVKFDGYERFG